MHHPTKVTDAIAVAINWYINSDQKVMGCIRVFFYDDCDYTVMWSPEQGDNIIIILYSSPPLRHIPNGYLLYIGT